MRTLTMNLAVAAMIAACLGTRGATFVTSTSAPGASPIVAVCVGDQPEVARIRLQHTQAPWDTLAPPTSIECAVANGVAQLAFTEIPFGVNTLELLAADGSIRSTHYMEKWVTAKGDHYLRADMTNCLFGSTTRPDATDLPQLVGATPGIAVYRGETPGITVVPPAADAPAGTITFSCSHDGTCAVWSGDKRIAVRRPYRVGEVKTITINPVAAPADKPLTVRLENGYYTAVLPLRPGQVPGWPVAGAGANAGASPSQPSSSTTAAGGNAAGNLGNFVVTRCMVHSQASTAGSRVKIEFAACASIVTPPQGDEPGVINTAGILSSGTWARISNPGVSEPKDVYLYRADDGAAVTGIARWRLVDKTAVFEGTLTINAHGVSTEFIDALTQGTKPLAIAVSWGDDKMAWFPVLSWSREAEGAWVGKLAE